MPRSGEWSELGVDALDAAVGAPARRWPWRWPPRRRPALGIQATAAPSFLYVAAGVLLGPAGLDVLTPVVLDQTQGLPWISLAVIGVYIGLGLSDEDDSRRETLIGAAIVSAITIAVVGFGLFVLARRANIHLTGHLPAAAFLVGLCASVSAAVPAMDHRGLQVRRAARFADLDDLPLVLLGAAAIAALAGPPVSLRVIATLFGGGAIGLAGWLLLERADQSERGLFVTGAVLLLAGIAAYLGTSPLLSGSAAAIVWVRAPGAADRITARDLRVLQHPLVALLLVYAGAMVHWHVATIWVAACILILRIAAKLLASVAAARLADVSPALLATVLLPPGIMGIALAVNVVLVAPGAFDWVLSSITVAAVVADVLAAFLPDVHEDPA
jgi:hypothetical protein